MLVFRQVNAEVGVSERDVELAVLQSSQAGVVMTNTAPKYYAPKATPDAVSAPHEAALKGQQKTGAEGFVGHLHRSKTRSYLKERMIFCSAIESSWAGISNQATM